MKYIANSSCMQYNVVIGTSSTIVVQ